MSLSELTPRPNRKHFFTALFPLVIVALAGLLLIFTWSGFATSPLVPIGGIILYFASLLHFCKRFGMTKNDAIWLSASTYAIVLAAFFALMAAFLFLFGSFYGGNFSWIAFLPYFVLGIAISVLVNLCVYSIILYALLAIVFPSKKKKNGKKNLSASRLCFFGLLLVSLTLCGCAGGNAGESGLQPQKMPSVWDLDALREMNAPIECNAVLYVTQESNGGNEVQLIKQEAYIWGDRLRIDQHDADQTGTVTIIQRSGMEYISLEFPSGANKDECAWQAENLTMLEECGYFRQSVRYFDGVDKMLKDSRITCFPANFGEEKFETPGKICDSSESKCKACELIGC